MPNLLFRSSAFSCSGTPPPFVRIVKGILTSVSGRGDKRDLIISGAYPITVLPFTITPSLSITIAGRHCVELSLDELESVNSIN